MSDHNHHHHAADAAAHCGHAHKSVAAPQAPAPADAIYTCPMHPEVRQIGPGFCPICGMALEPVTAALDTGPSGELVDMTRRFWISLVLTLPVFALEMGGHLTGLMMLLERQTSNWIQFALATPVVLWGGWPFFVRGWVVRHIMDDSCHPHKLPPFAQPEGTRIFYRELF